MKQNNRVTKSCRYCSAQRTSYTWHLLIYLSRYLDQTLRRDFFSLRVKLPSITTSLTTSRQSH